jgi:hypothetical protein
MLGPVYEAKLLITNKRELQVLHVPRKQDFYAWWT